MLPFPKFPELEPGKLLNATPNRRDYILNELCAFVESFPLSEDPVKREEDFNTTVGRVVTTHGYTLMRYYDRCDEALQKRIDALCDMDSYNKLDYDDYEEFEEF